MVNEEFILLLGLLIYPEMLPDIDLQPHEVSGKLSQCLDYLRSVEFDKLLNGGSITALMNLKRRKYITETEYLTFFDRLGEHDLMSSDVYHAYSFLKEEYKKNYIVGKLSQIDFQSETAQSIYDLISEEIKVLDSDNTLNDIQTFKDILPTAFSPQKSVVKFNHSKMQESIAIDTNYLIVLGARPATGKTTMAVKIAMDNAIHGKVLYISCEMTKEQIVRKSKHYQKGHGNVSIIYRANIGLHDISRLAKKIKPSLIIIDQLNKIVGKGKTEYDRFTYIANQLKMLAVRLDTPILVLAQINRSAEEGKRPFLHHFKGSGAMEEEADVAMILDIVVDSFGESITRVYVDKNRSLDGNIGSFDFNFDKSTNLYKEVSTNTAWAEEK